MQSSSLYKKHRPEKTVGPSPCRALCCSCKLSVSSSDESESSNLSDRFASISSIAHAMVQERLGQLINERHAQRSKSTRRERMTSTRFIVMVAMETSTCDPREDFRDSIAEMIIANRIREAKDLRRLLNYYVTMNSEECKCVILEAFHEVCTNLFGCKPCK